MSTLDHDTRVTIDWLRALPAGAVVRWATHHLTKREPYSCGWVDVRIPDGGPPGMGFVWTIIGPDDEDTPPPVHWEFIWPYDVDVHGVLDPGDGWYVNVWVTTPGAAVPPEVAEMYKTYPKRVDGAYHVRQGWSAEAVNAALTWWATTHAGRSDLRFERDVDAPPPEIIRVVEERARDIAEGGAVWDLGDGVHVADGVMDDLLAAEPDEAAEIMEHLRAVQRALRGDDDPDDE